MSRWFKKLRKEMESWVAEGLVTQEQSDRIRARYEREKEGPGWGMLIFSGLGAVIVGLGVILLFAYNWQVIPRGFKLLLVFGAFLAAHAAGLWLFFRKERFRGMGEALSVLGTMFFGAGIWLIAQIYHIDEHFPNGIIIWSLGALALAWAMPSVAQGALAAGLLAAWCGAEAFKFDTPMHTAPGIILVFVGLLAWRTKSRFLLAAVLATVIATLVFVMVDSHHGATVVVNTVMNLGVALVGAGMLARRGRRFPESAPVFSFFGWLIVLPIVFALTFEHASGELLDVHGDHELGWRLWSWWIASWVLALGSWSWIGVRSIARSPGWSVPIDHFLLPLAAIVCLVDLTLGRDLDHWMLAAPFNVVLLALIVGMMTRGCRHALTGPTVIGSLLLVAYMFARYFDLFESLFVRGLVFIVVGAAIFVQGLIFNRTRRRKAAKETPG